MMLLEINKYIYIAIVSIILFILCLNLRAFSFGGGYSEGFMSVHFTEIIKGISILVIVWCHICLQIGIRGVQFIAGVGVSVFLICSGYGLECSFEKRGLSHYFRDRIARLVIPLFFVRIISGIINNDLSVISTLQRMTYKAPWFVKYVFISYLIFGLCKIAVVKNILPKNKEMQFFITVYMIWFVLESQFFYDVSAPSLEARQMISFPFGIWLAKNLYRIEELFRKKNLLVCTSMVLLGFVCTALLETVIDDKVSVFVGNVISLLTVFPLSIGLICFLFHYFCLFDSKYLALLGKHSYELFLVHISVLSFLSNRTIKGLVIFLLLTTGITFFISLVSNSLISYIKTK